MAAQRRDDFSGDCEIQTCDRPQRIKGYCWAHYKRLQRGTPLHRDLQERLDPYSRLMKACEDVGAAPDDYERKIAVYRLRRAIDRYFGWKAGKRAADGRWRKARKHCPQTSECMRASPPGEQAAEPVHTPRQNRRRAD